MKNNRSVFLVVLFLLAGCGAPTQAPAPTAPPTPTPTLPSAITLATLTSESGSDPTVFGMINANDLQDMQGAALESVANAIFKKTMDGLVANGSIHEYQVTSLTILPSDEGFLAEIKYNVRSSDPAWLADGGTQAADGLITGNCSHFDFVITDTEFQLKNRRLCS